jgi:hypothetical protein
MFEKIYACLLRLFPPAFRREYQQEALRLLRDRLRDEKGFFRQLRLGFDLSVDLIGALPQAYRNSYPKAAPASPAPHFERAPSFQLLQKEPMRRGVVLIGGFVSVTALAAFIFVMQGPVAFHPADRKGHKSPIELVMEHLNQPLTVDAANKAPSAAFRSDSTAAGDQPARVVDQNPNPVDSGTAPSRVAATSSRAASPQFVQPAPIRVLARSANGLPPQAPATVLENVSAGWTGSWRAVDGDADRPHWFSLKQDGAKLSGTGGPNPSAQFPILNGLVTGDCVSFGLHVGQRTFLYDLKFQEQGPRGTVSVTNSNGKRTEAVRFERAR